MGQAETQAGEGAEHGVGIIGRNPPIHPYTPPVSSPTRRAFVLARDQGFALFGVARAEPSARAAQMGQWIAQGQHGEMHYLAEHLALRQDPRGILEGVKSILVVADAYSVDAAEEPNDANKSVRAPVGRFARYAHGLDYHETLKKRLHALANQFRLEFPEAQFRVTVDTAPIHEREVALSAGLGWIGKNTLLLHPRHGSFFLLGTLMTTLELEPAAQPEADHCANCRKCIEACPTQAISPEGYGLDARRCVSYLTLEHRSPIAPEFFAGMDDWLGGCDICQEVCPYNQIARKQPLPVGLGHKPRLEVVQGATILDVLGWTEEDRRRVFKGSSLKRMKLDMVRRNAVIAAGNALKKREIPALREKLVALAQDESEAPLVRQTAKTVLAH